MDRKNIIYFCMHRNITIHIMLKYLARYTTLNSSKTEVWDPNFEFYSKFKPQLSQNMADTTGKHKEVFQTTLNAIVPKNKLKIPASKCVLGMHA